MRALLIIIIFLSAVCTSNLHAQQSDNNYIEIVHMDRKPIVAAKINGKKTYLIVDTGSDISVLNIKSSAYFGFFPSVNRDITYQLEGLNGEKKQLSWAKKLSVTLGDSEIKARFYTMDLSRLMTSVRNKTHINVQGIIGSDIMKKYDFRVDFKNKNIGFSNKHAVIINSDNQQFSFYTVLKSGLTDIFTQHIY
ncbi:aspartyl protease family protein [Catalinimonas sp. 4WD22]|uniref:aspartyl protease family protein n=1 Tax=Catalinimonas locisalis TaxID=3133978 RepID=UPI00310119A6